MEWERKGGICRFIKVLHFIRLVAKIMYTTWALRPCFESYVGRQTCTHNLPLIFCSENVFWGKRHDKFEYYRQSTFLRRAAESKKKNASNENFISVARRCRMLLSSHESSAQEAQKFDKVCKSSFISREFTLLFKKDPQIHLARYFHATTANP